jgi:hypothetical protein
MMVVMNSLSTQQHDKCTRTAFSLGDHQWLKQYADGIMLFVCHQEVSSCGSIYCKVGFLDAQEIISKIKLNRDIQRRLTDAIYKLKYWDDLKNLMVVSEIWTLDNAVIAIFTSYPVNSRGENKPTDKVMIKNIFDETKK